MTKDSPVNGRERIKVLVLPSDTSGVGWGKFRSVDPHVKLQNLYPSDFHVDINYAPNLDDINQWKDYQIVHFHRSIGQDYVKAQEFIKKLSHEVTQSSISRRFYDISFDDGRYF